jgi:hypothetical protein
VSDLGGSTCENGVACREERKRSGWLRRKSFGYGRLDLVDKIIGWTKWTYGRRNAGCILSLK